MGAADKSDPDWLLALSLHEEEQEALCESPGAPLTEWGNPMFDEDRDEPHRLRTILRRFLPLHATRPSTAGCVPKDGVVTAERSRLMLRIDQYGLHEKAVRGDGNCQFRAVSDQLYRTEDFFKEVRAIATDRLQCYPEIYSSFVEGDYRDYVLEMRRDSAWGDHVTLKAIADHFGAEVCVLTSFAEGPVLRIVPETSKTLRTLWLSFWAEVHYNSLYPAKEPPAGT